MNKYEKYIGKTIGYITIESFEKNKASGNYIAICKCKCGNTCKRDVSKILKSNPKINNCNNCYQGIPFTDFIGKKYGYQTIIKFISDPNKLIKKVLCKCECGRTNIREFKVLVTGKGLTNWCDNCYKGISLENYIGLNYGNSQIKSFDKNLTAICKCECGRTFKRELPMILKIKNNSCGYCFNGIPYEDYIGKTYGCLTILQFINSDISGKNVLCQCKCGNRVVRRFAYLTRHGPDSCGSCNNGIPLEKYIGKVYGYFTIIGFKQYKNYRYSLICKCKCNKEKTKIYSINDIISGKITSCGCYQKYYKKILSINYGKLQIVKRSDIVEGGMHYLCKCECGNEIEVLESDLFTGRVTCCEDCKELI